MGRRKKDKICIVKTFVNTMNNRINIFDQNLFYRTRSRLWRNFGFIPLPHVPMKTNIKIIKQYCSKDCIPQLKNKAYHNLCKGSVQPPVGAVDVLGLGLNHCLETPIPQQGQNEYHLLQRLHRDIRLLAHFDKIGKDDDNNSEFDPNLYVPRQEWKPDEKNRNVEAKYFKFQDALLKRINQLPRTKQYNLTTHNRYCIKELRDCKDLVTGFTDKNLGLFIAPRADYIQEFLKEHLLKTDYYRQLSEREKNLILIKQRVDLLDLLRKHRHYLPEHHREYFDRSIKDINKYRDCIPQIYGCPKVHKTKKSKRPVESCCGSLPQVFSKYINHWLKKWYNRFYQHM